VPLYLEWAPDGVFVDAVIERNEQQLRNEDQGTSEQPPPTTDDAADSPPTEELCSPPDKPVDEPAVDDTCATVFVKNLAFETTDEQLCEKLGGVDGFVSATISKKRDVTSGQMLSMGYAFLTLRTHAHAVDAIKRMQNTSLHGHRLELKLSNRQMKRDSVAPTNKRGGKTEQGESTKILVRNVPFQVSSHWTVPVQYTCTGKCHRAH
jgi:multiple RNA-binding domain-containing protein 1